MADRNSYVPEERWEDYRERIASRYPYKMPPPVKRGPHPRVYTGDSYVIIPGGTYGKRILTGRRKLLNVFRSTRKS